MFYTSQLSGEHGRFIYRVIDANNEYQGYNWAYKILPTNLDGLSEIQMKEPWGTICLVNDFENYIDIIEGQLPGHYTGPYYSLETDLTFNSLEYSCVMHVINYYANNGHIYHYTTISPNWLTITFKELKNTTDPNKVFYLSDKNSMASSHESIQYMLDQMQSIQILLPENGMKYIAPETYENSYRIRSFVYHHDDVNISVKVTKQQLVNWFTQARLKEVYSWYLNAINSSWINNTLCIWLYSVITDLKQANTKTYTNSTWSTSKTWYIKTTFSKNSTSNVVNYVTRLNLQLYTYYRYEATYRVAGFILLKSIIINKKTRGRLMPTSNLFSI